MQGKWIAYPGDFELLLLGKCHTKRYRRQQRVIPGWRMDLPWSHVVFVRTFTLDKPTTFTVEAEGEASITMYKLPLYDVMKFNDCGGVVSLEAGEYLLECWVYHPTGLPCIRVSGEDVYSDCNFEVSNHTIEVKDYQMGEHAAAEIDCEDMSPNTWHLPLREIYPKSVENCDGGKVYDFGNMVMALPKITAQRGSEFKCYFGETLREANSDDGCEQIDFFTMQNETYQSAFARAFRYMRIVTDVKYELSVLEEYVKEAPALLYRSKNERMNEIIKVANRTFRLCSREFYLDGIKRDRWVWSGDAYQAFKTEYFYGYNTEKIKRTLRALFGKLPVELYINRIMDYTMYALMAIWEYFEQTGDKAFLREIYTIAKAHLQFPLGRLDENGLLVGRRGDWVFVDWGAMDKEGALCFEQVLLYLAMRSMEKVARCIGEEQDANDLQGKANALRARIDEFFWDETRGVYVHNYKNGQKSDGVTAYANVFAILYDLVDGEKAERIGNALLTAEYIPQITTPYMQEFKLACLFKLGQWQTAAKEIDDYWGGMLDGGATTFWETYTPGETVEEATDMYGTAFGRSQCHIWGASVLYLIPKYYFGIENNLNFGERFTIKPNLELIKESQITVALKRGILTIKCYEGALEVYATELDGELVLDGKSYPVMHGQTLGLTY